MKKLAFISGLLFFVVYLGVNTLTTEENSFDVIYPSVPVSTLTTLESPAAISNENPFNPTTNKLAPSQSDASTAKYNYLIVASFSDLDQANKVAEEYSGKYQAEMLVLPPASNGYYRVSYGRYSSIAEASEALTTVKQADFPDAWLLPSK